MKWRDARQSTNIEDRRGQAAPAVMGCGGLMVSLFLAICCGVGSDDLFELKPQPAAPSSSSSSSSSSSAKQRRAERAERPSPRSAPGQSQVAAQDRRDFVAVVLADTEDAWHKLFKRAGKSYQEPVVVLYDDAVSSDCGTYPSATGPFYCPSDQKIYLDLTFFDDMALELGAPGDFAMAYVIAHEVGHHVQQLRGTLARVDRQSAGLSKAEANALSVRSELQADCFAGVWAYHASRQRDMLEDGDLQEALTAAAAIGDDRLAKQAGQRSSPESFTHGTSAQRERWFRRGWTSGDPAQCDTFKAKKL